MSLPAIHSFEIKESKTGKPVPIINDVHLHSAYNPEKEAVALIEKHQEVLKAKKQVVVLGLGFAYHINALTAKMRELHGEEFFVAVIEPSAQTVKNCHDLNMINDPSKILIFGGSDIGEIFRDKIVVNLLSNKPAIISHPASFNLYESYFKKFLSHRADNRIGELRKVVVHDDLKTYLGNYNDQMSLDDVTTYIKNSEVISNDIEFAILAYEKLTQACKTNQGQSL